MSKIGKPRTSKGLAVFCAKIAEEKRAGDVLILDMEKIETAPANFFVICSCDADVHVKALADAIERKSKEVGLAKPKTEGTDNLSWVLMDFFDVVMHIMLKESRNYYKLEKLWGDARFLRLNENGAPRVYKQENLNKLYSEYQTD